MGFIRGVITGVAVATGAAAWYMSKAGERFRNQYRVDRKLGDLGDEIDERTREVRARAGAQVAELRAQADAVSSPRGRGHLDDAEAAAAEAAAEIAADVEAKAAKVKKAGQGHTCDARHRARLPTCADVRWFARPDLDPEVAIRHRRASAKTKSHVPAGQDRQSTRARRRPANRCRPTCAPPSPPSISPPARAAPAFPSEARSASPAPACTPARSPSSRSSSRVVIPQAVVRTEAGKTRQVRTIDLEPVAPTTPSRSSPADPAAPVEAWPTSRCVACPR